MEQGNNQPKGDDKKDLNVPADVRRSARLRSRSLTLPPQPPPSVSGAMTAPSKSVESTFGASSSATNNEVVKSPESRQTSISDLYQNLDTGTSGNVQLSDEGDYPPLGVIRREVRIGEDYQAYVPDKVPSQPSPNPPSRGSSIQSSPSLSPTLSLANFVNDEITNFLFQARQLNNTTDEALNILKEEHYNISAAVARLKRKEQNAHAGGDSLETGGDSDECSMPPLKKDRK